MRGAKTLKQTIFIQYEKATAIYNFKFQDEAEYVKSMTYLQVIHFCILQPNIFSQFS